MFTRIVITLTIFFFQTMMEIEQTILSSDTDIPIYVLDWSPKVKQLMDNLGDSKIVDENASSAVKGTQKLYILNCSVIHNYKQ